MIEDDAVTTPPAAPPAEPEQLGIKDTIAALRSDMEGDGEVVPRAFAPTQKYAQQLAAAGKTPEQIAEQMRAEGYAQSVVEAALGAAPSAEGGSATATEEHPLRVTLPPRRPDEEPIEVELPDAETAARVRHALNLRRGEEGIDSAELNLHYLNHLLQRDPALFAVKYLTPEARERLYELVDDPEAIARAEQAVDVEASAVVESKRSARDVVRAVEAMIPPNLDDATAQLLRDDCLRDVIAHIKGTGAKDIDVAELPKLLALRFGVYNVDASQAAQRLASGMRRSFRQAARESNAEDAGAAGKRLAAAGATRRALAALPGAGAGARASKLEPPPKQTLKERLKWAREKLLGS